MNLTIGCKLDQQYYLMNGEPIDKREWTSLVMEHIKQNGNEQDFEKTKSTVKLWNKHDTIEEVAMQVYASKYCTNLQLDKRRKEQVLVKVIKDELGYQQLVFC
ncbi:MAG: hypothetical protein J6D39_05810 [Niameybacter sp.]|nr:hypothetical protein [Niameybacter sp.]